MYYSTYIEPNLLKNDTYNYAVFQYLKNQKIH